MKALKKVTAFMCLITLLLSGCKNAEWQENNGENTNLASELAAAPKESAKATTTASSSDN